MNKKQRLLRTFRKIKEEKEDKSPEKETEEKVIQFIAGKFHFNTLLFLYN